MHLNLSWGHSPVRLTEYLFSGYQKTRIDRQTLSWQIPTSSFISILSRPRLLPFPSVSLPEAQHCSHFFSVFSKHSYLTFINVPPLTCFQLSFSSCLTAVIVIWDIPAQLGDSWSWKMQPFLLYPWFIFFLAFSLWGPCFIHPKLFPVVSLIQSPMNTCTPLSLAQSMVCLWWMVKTRSSTGGCWLKPSTMRAMWESW
jgi:hypothetical protein